MATLTTLEEDVLHLICEHLPINALKSVSLTHRVLSRVYLRHCLRHFEIVTSINNQARTIEFLKRCGREDCFKYIRHFSIDDTSKPTRHSDQLLWKVFSETLPKLTGLRTVTWNIARYPTSNSKGLKIQDLCNLRVPPTVQISIKFYNKTGFGRGAAYMHRSLHTLSSGHRGFSHLVSIELDIVWSTSNHVGTFNNMLSAAPQLRHLGVHFIMPMVSNPSSELEKASRWTASDVAKFPALKSLDIPVWNLDASSLMNWAVYGDWSSLEAIKVPNDLMLQYMVGQTPRLRSMTVDQLCPWLPEFLAQVPQLSVLAFSSLKPGAPSAPLGFKVVGPNRFGRWNYIDLEDDTSTQERDENWTNDEQRTLGKNYADIASLLRLPFASKLKSLHFNLHQDGKPCERPQTVEASLIASLCPNLIELTVAIIPEHLSLGTFTIGDTVTVDWIKTVAHAVAKMPDLRRLEVVIPRRLQIEAYSTTMPVNPQYVTMASLEQLLTDIRLRRQPYPRLTEVTVTCVMGCNALDGYQIYQRKSGSEPAILFNFQNTPYSQGRLTFTGTLAENQEKAAQGEYVLFCPELQRVETALKRGNLNLLREDLYYRNATEVVDDVEALAYRGKLVYRGEMAWALNDSNDDSDDAL